MLKRIPLLVPIIALLTAATSGVGPNPDPAFYGFWVLQVEQSDFGGQEKPKGGLVNWSENGWVFAVSNPQGGIYADAVMTKGGCTLIGAPSDYSCELKTITTRHLKIWLRQGTVVLREGDIELIDNDTTRATHRVTPKQGTPYTETTIWRRQTDG